MYNSRLSHSRKSHFRGYRYKFQRLKWEKGVLRSRLEPWTSCLRGRRKISTRPSNEVSTCRTRMTFNWQHYCHDTSFLSLNTSSKLITFKYGKCSLLVMSKKLIIYYLLISCNHSIYWCHFFIKCDVEINSGCCDMLQHAGAGRIKTRCTYVYATMLGCSVLGNMCMNV